MDLQDREEIVHHACLLFQGKAQDFHLKPIHRSREVGQSYLTSILTTLLAMAHAFVMVWQEHPDVVSMFGWAKNGAKIAPFAIQLTAYNTSIVGA